MAMLSFTVKPDRADLASSIACSHTCSDETMPHRVVLLPASFALIVRSNPEATIIAGMGFFPDDWTACSTLSQETKNIGEIKNSEAVLFLRFINDSCKGSWLLVLYTKNVPKVAAFLACNNYRFLMRKKYLVELL